MLVKSFNEMVEKLGERKDLEEKLKKTEQLSMIGQLASGIAHEIRNPLNFLSLSIGHIKERLAEEGMSESDDINNLLDNLKKELYRVNELINNFLFVGKPITLNKGWVSAEALMQDALYMVTDKIRDGIEITCDGPEGDMQIYCDREYMRMCLINLILNSAQAIEDKGTIVVTFAAGDGMSVHFCHRQRQGRGGRGHREDIRALLLDEEAGHRPRAHHNETVGRRARRHDLGGEHRGREDGDHDKGAGQCGLIRERSSSSRTTRTRGASSRRSSPKTVFTWRTWEQGKRRLSSSRTAPSRWC